jgi:hypothetical protein
VVCLPSLSLPTTSASPPRTKASSQLCSSSGTLLAPVLTTTVGGSAWPSDPQSVLSAQFFKLPVRICLRLWAAALSWVWGPYLSRQPVPRTSSRCRIPNTAPNSPVATRLAFSLVPLSPHGSSTASTALTPPSLTPGVFPSPSRVCRLLSCCAQSGPSRRALDCMLEFLVLLLSQSCQTSTTF